MIKLKYKEKWSLYHKVAYISASSEWNDKYF
jgi:hypothetical protein